MIQEFISLFAWFAPFGWCGVRNSGSVVLYTGNLNITRLMRQRCSHLKFVTAASVEAWMQAAVMSTVPDDDDDIACTRREYFVVHIRQTKLKYNNELVDEKN